MCIADLLVYIKYKFAKGWKLDQNYLTGPIPAFLGNLSSLQILSLGINALSGPVPKELGNLRNLQLLAFGSNNLSGSLPPQLGSLTNLQQIYIDSSGVGGEIPSTFANLVNMQTVWASDNAFTGRIPDFIGNWTKLTSLRFQGNSFEGPVPSSLSNLTLLTDLRISDLSNVSSSLDFIKDMKDLSILVLRNNMISGSIPSSVGEYGKLQRLDLSFNNLTGRIPSSLFNLSSLSYLFLGNNSLSGTLPSQKSPTLLNIDLSYNELSGSLPSWATLQNLTLNLVANNFTEASLTNSVLTSGLNCLQRNFSCNRNPPRYSSFAIKCGGPEMRSSGGTIFERDNSTLGPASYYVTDTRRWAVSNVGLFGEREGAAYTLNTLSQITGTLDSELFQTSRISGGSLRYYGLGLENGIYNVNLQFAETAFRDPSSRTWESLGRRVFDIYLQGNRRIKDFDIRNAAGGASNRAVQRDFKVQVTQNFLEIHLFWAGKGTCCIPQQGSYGPSISAISVTPDFQPNVSNLPPTDSKKSKTGLIVGVVVSVAVVSFIVIFALFYIRRKRSRTNEEEELLGIENRPNTFTYAELRNATEDFNSANKLGEGGFGSVYKGMLSDGRAVAVKQLSVASHQGKSQFVAEIATISAVQHRNLVKLYGCCIEGANRLLVYEYLEYRSLDQALFGKSSLHLSWQNRYEICLGAARGLAYLHEESRPRIVHRDVKASNILLDTDLNPKISDFGLAKLYDDKKTHISTRVAGTIGYLAPEYAMRGHLTEKADVFGFGVVALEILSGRPNSDTTLETDKIYLLEWAWNLHENNRALELVDPSLTEFNEGEAMRMIGVAFLCTQASPMLRPAMSRVVGMMTGDIEVSTVTSKPSYITDWQFNDISSFVSNGESDTLTSKTTNTQLDISTDTSAIVGRDQSPAPTQPMLHEIIGEGR
ncbi:Protein kinase domain [Macleaya cordata]|uniref:non-specific serine/threonine protein kinase n=1 Tax=Macleaya cordata TaxID=56857 RepID=A0A200QZF8_MACCD|nr:Protein kinase domain [Macleaya cordata]